MNWQELLQAYIPQLNDQYVDDLVTGIHLFDFSGIAFDEPYISDLTGVQTQVVMNILTTALSLCSSDGRWIQYHVCIGADIPVDLAATIIGQSHIILTKDDPEFTILLDIIRMRLI